MNTQAHDGSLAGGGEILQFWGNADAYNSNSPYLDNELIKQFGYIPLVKFIIMLLILFLMVAVILKLFNIKSPFKGKGITRELDYMEKIRKHDLSVMRANKLMTWMANFVAKTPFTLSTTSREYWDYNLSRAGIKIPGGARLIKAQEFYGVVTFAAMCCAAVSAFIVVFVNSIVGWLLLITVVVMASTMPMAIIRGIVREKDLEIKENFADYYLMLHYVLISSASTPLEGIMKSYAKTTSSKEMQRYIDSCVHYIDTYGEYEATRYVASDFREIPEVGKLMRLIRQANEGGEIEAELNGFRNELLKAKQYAIEKRMEKLIMKARASFNLLMPILVQAILSAMAIYVSDLGMAGTLIGM